MAVTLSFLVTDLANSTYNLDTEIARSLLDLSRKVEAQGIGETATRSLETENGGFFILITFGC